MRVMHELEVECTCPVNHSTRDVYNVWICVSRLVAVEDIHDAVRAATSEPRYQEDITQQIADILSAEVTSVGYHSGVKTTCAASF